MQRSVLTAACINFSRKMILKSHVDDKIPRFRILIIILAVKINLRLEILMLSPYLMYIVNTMRADS